MTGLSTKETRTNGREVIVSVHILDLTVWVTLKCLV